MTPNESKVRVRFPPSPTGAMHIGNVRTLLFNYLFARQRGGEIVFRSEDTDRERSNRDFEDQNIANLQWLGLNWDEGVFRQSERYEVYEKYFEKLKASGAIYPAYETAEELAAITAERAAQKLPPGYDNRARNLTAEQIAAFEAEGRKPAWRVRVPHEVIKFQDVIRGEISERGELISDFVIRKADGQFLYHFVVVVDDIEMRISHIIRGEDHISNTPKHAVLYRAFGHELPIYAHLPLLLNSDRSKMSKRDKSGKPMSLARLREEGYLPAAILNYLALLGWNPGDTREFLSFEELVKEFDLSRVQKAGAIFDFERLKFFNSYYIRQMPLAELAESIRPLADFDFSDSERFAAAMKLIDGKASFLQEIPGLIRFFFVRPAAQPELLANEKMGVTVESARANLAELAAELEQIQDWSEENLKNHLLGWIAAKNRKNGEYLWPLRVAVTGEKFSPGAFEVAAVLGREETLARLAGYAS